MQGAAACGGYSLYFAQLTGAGMRASLLDDMQERLACLAPLRPLEAFIDGVDLRGADLRGAYLVQANLIGADLRGVRLDGADVRLANFSGAILDSDTLKGANTGGAQFCEVASELREEITRRYAN